jgi:uncharacterized protein YbaP (TraB family)
MCRFPLLAIAALALACASDRSDQNAETPRDAPGPTLWFLDDSAYLFGTVHYGYSSDELPANVLDAFARSDMYVPESNHDNAAVRLVLKQLEGPTSDTRIDPSVLDTLARLADKYEFYENENAMGKMTPVALATYLQVELMRARDKYGGPRPHLDDELLARATSESKQVRPLEGPLDQVHAIAPMTDEEAGEVIGSVISILDDDETFAAHCEQFHGAFVPALAAYRNGDPRKAIAVLGADQRNHANTRVFTERNMRWLPAIESYAESPSLEFIAVGLGHLAGIDNIIDMLERRGHSVREISP